MSQDDTPDLAAPQADKVAPEAVALRAQPRPVTRLNRRSLAILAGVLAVAVLGALMWSLQPHRRSTGEQTELYNVDRVSKSEGLDALPTDYSKLPPALLPAVPELGPPLPGDLGPAIVKSQQPATAAYAAPGHDPNDALRKEAEAAAASSVFFRSGGQNAAPVAQTQVAAAPGFAANAAFDPLAAGPASTAAQPADPTAVQNRQDQKEAFMKAGPTETRNSGNLTLPISPYQVMAGTVVAGALVTGIKSDLPGDVIATVTEPVYDTATGRFLLIPQGSRIIQPEHPNSDLEGLLSMFQHDQTHFSKMVANLLPIMNMLTSGELGPLLSPDSSDLSDERQITDSAKIINNAQVAYLGLDSLTDNMVGSAMGSIFLSDLTAVAGDRYNYGVNNRPVNIFVDEAAEVINDPFIQLLNKGRGAKLRLFVATQTFADFAARLGSKDKALQVLGNINNTFALRIVDGETQEYIADNLPKTRLKYVMRTQGQNTDGKEPIMHGGNQGERLMEEEADLFPAQLLGMLPNLEYIAKISGGTIVKGRLPILTQ
ncbi:TrbI/VirB10 family protein [Serratia marcescens]|uniref:TrbI/VirB10 family protein n=1 Tax=Serratia marcescens TaxID=615 RepID=UPI00077E0A66